MWKNGWRDEVWSQLDQEWDLIVVGGGITGAGVFHEAAALGLKVLLVEACDFSFGTSSRSSKLAHGGFRYLYNRQYQVTFESVQQREALLREAPGLVTPLAFTLPNFSSYRFPGWTIRAGLCLYDLMAPKWDHQSLNAADTKKRFAGLRADGLLRGYRYKDAELDDSRLVLRVLKEGVMLGGTAINYARVDHLLRNNNNQVCGVALSDAAGPGGKAAEVKALAVVNATGPWSDELRSEIGARPRMRKLRGSHLILSRESLPVSEAITLFHPKNRRAMFLLPWEGASVIGTTDIDHDPGLEKSHAETFASQDEITYMLDALGFLFPGLSLTNGSIISSFSGLRPIIDTGAPTPSKESRAHQVWNEDGLITITGGKLTTFRLMARQTLQAVLTSIGSEIKVPRKTPLLAPLDRQLIETVSPQRLEYLRGRYGLETSLMLSSAEKAELHPIDTLPNLWAELRWAARAEGIVHLDDLLLRRVRLGLLLPEGGKEFMPRIKAIVRQETGWDEARWKNEEAAYWKIWNSFYSPHPG